MGGLAVNLRLIFCLGILFVKIDEGGERVGEVMGGVLERLTDMLSLSPYGLTALEPLVEVPLLEEREYGNLSMSLFGLTTFEPRRGGVRLPEVKDSSSFGRHTPFSMFKSFNPFMSTFLCRRVDSPSSAI